MEPKDVTCYLPIEVKARELDTKLYLAISLVKKGFSVVIGSKSNIHKQMFKKNKPFIYFDKGISPLNSNFYNAIKASKGLIVEIQEEGNVSKNTDVIILSHNNPSAELVSLIFTWGELPRKIILENCSKLNPKNIVATGHPSIDLLHKDLIIYYQELAKVKNKIRPGYILINTNFAHYNGYINFEESKKYNDNIDELYNEKKRREWQSIEKIQEKVLNEFLKMIKNLSKLVKEKEIVIRPHPLEKKDIYEKEFAEYENINVIREGSAREWIINAESVVHYDCTTGIESLIIGKNVISFCPYFIKELVANLPIDISLKFSKAEDLISYIQNDYKDKDYDFSEIRKKNMIILKKYMANVENKATDKIVKNLENLTKNWAKVNSQPLKKLYYLCKIKLKNLILNIKRRIKKYNNINIRQKSKFSHLNLREIDERLNIWYKCLSINKKFVVNELRKDTFLIREEVSLEE